MQLTETVTIINKSGKVISNGKHIVNVFKEAKAAYQDKKAALKAERATEARPGIRKAQTYSPGYYAGHEDDVPERKTHYLSYEDGQNHTREPRYLEDGSGRRRSNDDAQSHASSRRSHGSHRSKKTRDKSGKSSRLALTETNLRTLSEVSSTTPSQVPRAYHAAYVETAAPRANMQLARPNLKHATTAPPGATDTRKKDIDMNLAYGDIPPDLGARTDLGAGEQAEEESERVELNAGEDNNEDQARTLMERIEALLDEAECVHHTATSIIDHLQRKPEAAAAVALLLAELSTVLKAISPGFLGVVKGGFPAIFALLASPQFLVGVGVAVGVTVVCFGGWKIVKRIQEAKTAAKAKEKTFEMQEQAAAASTPDAGVPPADGQSVFDDALVLEEELGAIETWRRGIAPPDDYELASVVESADLELITPEAARSVRDDGRSIRTAKTHRSSKSHRSHKGRRHEDGDKDREGDGTRRKSSSKSKSKAADVESVADSERSRRTARSKTATRTATKALTDGGDQDENTLDVVLRPKDKKPNMLKTMFRKKKDRDDGRDSAVSVMG
ncbi:hypothetical protein VM1G_09117 [Cytospora mali]|uniref:Uncharacterized protein n=1 Tax=Cytospora mali TaxID=578113 RepID=A0A194WA04_CYTMA|nr:hypothetical protein VM1G_09117 [Valsa mali]